MKKLPFLLALACLTALCALACAQEAHEGFRLMAQSPGRKLYLNETTLQVRVEDTATGLYIDSKIMNGKSGSGSVKRLQKSDLNVSYIVNQKVGTLGVMENWSLSTDLGNYEISPLENGFSVRYTIGDISLVIDDLPKMIPVTTYNERLMPFWTEKEIKLFRDHYRVVNNINWIRIKDEGMGAMVLKQLYGMLYVTGQYTREDLERDNEAIGYVIETMNPKVAVTVRYTLEGDDLIVAIPCDEIESISPNPVQMIEPLPYFLTATGEQDGYLFVPDGTGSLIYLGNGKTTALSYLGAVYGADVLRNASRYSAPLYRISLPVYGIKADDLAVLAIIEQGAEMAEIYADISGRSDEFNRVSSRFILRPIESVALLGNETVTTPRWPEDTYTGEIVLRYRFFTGDNAHYAAMAKSYRAYLLERGLLQERSQEARAPFFAEVLGAVRKNKFILGIPFASTVQATTLPQAGVIYDALRGAGIDNIKLELNGLFTGGIHHASLTRLALDKGMGGKAALRNLQGHLAQNGDQVFYTVALGRVYTARGFSRTKQAARMLDGLTASVVPFAEPTYRRTWYGVDSWYISPYYLPTYVDKTLQNLAPYAPGGLSVTDLGGALTPDYKRRAHLSRVHATPYYQAALSTLAEAYPLMLQTPNLYALRSASYVTCLPSSDNGYKVEDAAVPFLQMVLEGTVHYCAESWNLSAHNDVRGRLLYAIETKSAPRFTFTYAEPTIFHNIQETDLQRYFSTQYKPWVEEAAALWAEYDAFYQRVRDAQIVRHEILTDDVRRVVYDNGVTVLLNYGSTAYTADGVVLPPGDYRIWGGE